MGLQTIRHWHLARLVRLASSDPSLPPCYFSGVQLHLVWHHSARAATGDVHLCSAALCQLGHYNQNETQQKPMDPASRQAYGNAEGAAIFNSTLDKHQGRPRKSREGCLRHFPRHSLRNGQGQAEMRLRGAGSLARATRLHEEVFASRNQGLQKASLCKAIATDGTSDDPHAPD